MYNVELTVSTNCDPVFSHMMPFNFRFSMGPVDPIVENPVKNTGVPVFFR